MHGEYQEVHPKGIIYRPAHESKCPVGWRKHLRKKPSGTWDPSWMLNWIMLRAPAGLAITAGSARSLSKSVSYRKSWSQQQSRIPALLLGSCSLSSLGLSQVGNQLLFPRRKIGFPCLVLLWMLLLKKKYQINIKLKISFLYLIISPNACCLSTIYMPITLLDVNEETKTGQNYWHTTSIWKDLYHPKI